MLPEPAWGWLDKAVRPIRVEGVGICGAGMYAYLGHGKTEQLLW
ncbi:hypothetical protein [Sulfitobacter donghicola]|uniref:Uncharacterized protein n=1 Tax=Sulfitobacter donghicola DSW-25 = KCTC 12864 = JCM 14565 TaxID=1300350 RepID=A0A073IJ90_9RHOB|nr:hypothetical protein [Sulfitobacter donghicola]KEJ89645.1 hypothetical protein DSW25_09970 [Sulfitobacter donghicola DSW-25 = KCTC 12864 = JCM 14565]KIN69141.1 hypothetical protein Z948_2879 [Sulfitobacter donghicola DSW-25 = KCTC 12864 = JCM 14565]